jgi:hypothetical protein
MGRTVILRTDAAGDAWFLLVSYVLLFRREKLVSRRSVEQKFPVIANKFVANGKSDARRKCVTSIIRKQVPFVRFDRGVLSCWLGISV